MVLSIAERHNHILNVLSTDGYIKVIDIAKQLDVTTVTVRKDLKILEEKGLLYRFHGSASLMNPHASDRSVKEKEKEKANEKQAIAKKAAELIELDDSILLNSGSTICMFAQQIAPKGKLVVVTPSIEVTDILSENDRVSVLQLGGAFRKSSMSVIGNYAVDYLKNVTCSKLFLGVDGIDLDFGVTTSNVEEAELNRAMMNVSLKTIVLCDSSKFGRKGFGKICDLDHIDAIVTDDNLPTPVRKELEELGIKLIIATL